MVGAAEEARPATGRAVGIVLVVVFLLLALAGPAKILLDDDDGPGAGRVGMAGLLFSPEARVVPAGTEGLFVNDDGAPHTVTATDSSVDSGLMSPGDTFALVINEPLDYICAIHSNMQGEIEIEA